MPLKEDEFAYGAYKRKILGETEDGELILGEPENLEITDEE